MSATRPPDELLSVADPAPATSPEAGLFRRLRARRAKQLPVDAFRNVVFGFIAVLVVLVAGFWESYFSVLFQGMHPTHHFHGITMLAWVLLLITQAALVRKRRFRLHRMTGRISYVLAPLVVVSGVLVNLHFIERVAEPLFRVGTRGGRLRPGRPHGGSEGVRVR